MDPDFKKMIAVCANPVSVAEFPTPVSTGHKSQCARLFWIWLIGRSVAWTWFVAVAWPNPRLDLPEMVCLGREWQWGYTKHPPLPCWLGAVFAQLSPGAVWGVSLAGYLCTALAIWAAWRVAREMLSPRLALMAALGLDGVVFLNQDPADFNHNVALNLFWALAVLGFYRAVSTSRTRWWLATGLAVGLGMLCKYTMVLLAGSMVLFLILDTRARAAWRRPGLYLAGLVALGVFAPHAWWVLQNGFTTISYASQSLRSQQGWLGHLWHPTRFALGFGVIALPMLAILKPVLSWRVCSASPVHRWPRQRWNRSFLVAMVAGPVVLHLLLALLIGSRLATAWGFPLFTFVGVLLLVALGKEPNRLTLMRFGRRWAVALSIFWGWALFQAFGQPYVSSHASRIHFPGRELTGQVKRLWQERCDQPFAVVAGDPWLAVNVACYAAHRPSAYLDASAARWTSDEDVRTRGGVLLWNAAQQGDGLPASVRPRFPSAEVLPPLVLPYHCAGQVQPARIGIALQLPNAHP